MAKKATDQPQIEDSTSSVRIDTNNEKRMHVKLLWRLHCKNVSQVVKGLLNMGIVENDVYISHNYKLNITDNNNCRNGSCLTWLATSLEEKRRWLIIDASPRGQCSK